MAIASSLSLTPSPTPTQTSPMQRRWATRAVLLEEGGVVGVGLGRIIGFNHLDWLHDAPPRPGSGGTRPISRPWSMVD